MNNKTQTPEGKMSTGKVILIAAAALVLIAALLFLLLYGRSLLFQYSGSKGGKKVTMGPFTDFHFSNPGGSYMNAGYSYDAELRDGKVIVTVRLDGMPQEDARTMETDVSFMKTLEEISEKYNVKKWNGFNRSNKYVLDGYGFSLSIVMENGESLSAHGYMAWPDNFTEFSREVIAHFTWLYETYYPNRERALDTYFSEELVPEHGLLEKTTDIGYPYLCAPDNRYTYRAPDIPEGIVAHVTNDFTHEQDSGYTEETDMLVAYIRKGETDENGYTPIQLEIELYTTDEDANVSLLFRDLADDALFFNDGIMSWLFSFHEDGRLYIGYYSVKSDRVSTGQKERRLKIYGPDGDLYVKLADESAEGPDRGDWTEEMMAALMQTADAYGLTQSTAKWRNDPADSTISVFEINQIVSVSTYSSADSQFSAKLAETEPGNEIGEYIVKGGLYGNNEG